MHWIFIIVSNAVIHNVNFPAIKGKKKKKKVYVELLT